VQVRRTGKGCLSYIVASDGEALVVDPSLPPYVYLDLASQRGWRIRSFVKTHIHADHLSRAREVAQRAGAQLFLPAQQRVHFPFMAVADGDLVRVGRAALTARRTPGHTDESTSYVLDGEAVFTGDTLFTKGVGRPDLHADVEGSRKRATLFFRSLTELRTLGPDVLVLPAHASEPIPFDRRPVSARMSDVAAWLSEWLVSESVFVDRVVARVPATPPKTAAMSAASSATSADSLPHRAITNWGRRGRAVCRRQITRLLTFYVPD
jgi:glyoxylase-like metal-dependent hydrolase (beta-lactamase superfamily II)